MDYDSKWSTNIHKKIVCWNYFLFHFKTSFEILIHFKLVLGTMSDTELLQQSKIELYRVVDYDSKWSTKFYEDCMLELFLISL